MTARLLPLGLLPLVLAGCPGPTARLADSAAQPFEEPSVDPGPEGHTFTTFSGTAEWRWAWSKKPGDYACDLIWATESTGAQQCPGCDWAFDVTFTYQPDQSVDADDCFATLDEGQTDFSWGLGMSPDYLGYGFPFVMYYDTSSGYWQGSFYADWHYPDLVWGLGSLDRPYTQNGETYYYSANWYGQATVQ